MSCNFSKWVIGVEHANSITPNILNSSKEEAGGVLFRNHDLKSSSIFINSEGKTDSVRINLKDNHMISFHTHPITAYIDNQCIYGHPSGDDISHFIRISLKGALNHAVFAVEGIYLVQIHPRLVRYMLSLSPTNREFLLNKIYEYFRVYHGKRHHSYVKRHNYTPREFVTECNALTLQKLHLPEGKFDEKKIPKRLISCVWYFTDDVLTNEKNYTQLWDNIKNRNIAITYEKRKNPIAFKFLSLNTSDRTLNNILHTITECNFSS